MQRQQCAESYQRTHRSTCKLDREPKEGEPILVWEKWGFDPFKAKMSILALQEFEEEERFSFD